MLVNDVYNDMHITRLFMFSVVLELCFDQPVSILRQKSKILRMLMVVKDFLGTSTVSRMEQDYR